MLIFIYHTNYSACTNVPYTHGPCIRVNERPKRERDCNFSVAADKPAFKLQTSFYAKFVEKINVNKTVTSQAYVPRQHC